MDRVSHREQSSSQAISDDSLFSAMTDCVEEAGRIALSYFGENPRTEVKPDGTSVSEADLAVDRFLHDTLRAIDPSYGWLSEETHDDRDRLQRTRVWVVDPIDGTRAFLKDRPEWTVCVALVDDGQPLMAAVFNPAKGEFFHAVSGGGSFLNCKPITVPEPVALEGCTLAASATMFRSERWLEPWPDMETVWVNSIAYRLALVAAGTCDGTVSMSGKCDWDIAAADLIVREAGGIMSTADFKPFTYNRPQTRHSSVVAAGPALHAELIARTSQAKI